MQLMPSVASSLGVDPFDPGQAIPAAARLLSSYRDQFGSWPLALAAYNAGPGAVEEYSGIPPYAQTTAYVSSVLTAAGMDELMPAIAAVKSGPTGPGHLGACGPGRQRRRLRRGHGRPRRRRPGHPGDSGRRGAGDGGAPTRPPKDAVPATTGASPGTCSDLLVPRAGLDPGSRYRRADGGHSGLTAP